MMTKDILRTAAARTMEWPFRLWGFGEAIGIRGLLVASAKLDDPEPRGYVHALLRTWLGKGGPRSPADHVAPGRELLYFYEHTEEEIYLDAAYRLAHLHASFPANKQGARMHRPDQPGWRRQIWVDCMDAEAPFLAHLAALTGEDRFYRQATEEALAYARTLQDEPSGLFYHGFEEDCGRNGQVWARGNGWALLGLVETLLSLPSEHSSYGELRQRLVALCEGLERHQDETGLWHTVIPAPETYLESALAAMAAYALRGAFTANLLEREQFGFMEGRARSAVKKEIDEDGVLRRVSDATPIGELSMYATRPFGCFPWGQGPLLLMLSQELQRK